MSGRGGAAQLGLRWKAVGLMTSGLTSRQVASKLGVHQSSVSRWFKKGKGGILGGQEEVWEAINSQQDL